MPGPANPSPKSCYVLELSVGPGGSRWAELHAYAALADIEKRMRKFCAGDSLAYDMAAYHIMQYGATVAIWVVQRGEVIQFLDLHPYVRARLPDDRWVRSDEKETYAAFVEEIEESDEWERFDDVQLALDWDAVPGLLPALEAPLLAEGDTFPIAGRDTVMVAGKPVRPETGTYLTLDDVRFGSFTLEDGSDDGEHAGRRIRDTD